MGKTLKKAIPLQTSETGSKAGIKTEIRTGNQNLK
jgi:hypothetical protein